MNNPSLSVRVKSNGSNPNVIGQKDILVNLKIIKFSFSGLPALKTMPGIVANDVADFKTKLTLAFQSWRNEYLLLKTSDYKITKENGKDLTDSDIITSIFNIIVTAKSDSKAFTGTKTIAIDLIVI